MIAGPAMPDFQTRYRAAFDEYLRDRSERALGAAYELGRSAVGEGTGVLDLADAHHHALASALSNGASRPDVAQAAADFFREALATFELALRGYTEAHETARLESEHAHRQRMLAAASLAINAELDPASILRVAAEQARLILDARRAEAEIHVRREIGMPRTGIAPERLLRAVAAEDDEDADEDPHGRRLEAPIVGRAGRLGTLAAIDPARPEAEQEPIATQLAQMASVAVENAQRYEREQLIAQTLQRSLLPPSLPEIPGLEIAARFSPAGDGIQVGGDFYDVFRAGDDEWCMVIGDVCGKGPEAAALTALTRYTIRAAALHERRPSRVLALLNEAMLEQRQDGRFATVLYLRLILGAGRVRVVAASGGHPLPLLLRRDGRVDAVGAGGTLLGVVERPVLPDAEVMLDRGETLVLYTDGVIEVRSGGKEIFGSDDLADLLARCSGMDPEALLGHIVHQVMNESGGRPQDDVALLAIRVRG